MAKKKNIAPQSLIKEPEKKVKISSVNNLDYPIFCLKHLQDASFTRCTNMRLFKLFVERMRDLASLDWHTINQTPRHGKGGYELMPISSLKPKKMPPFITDEVDKLMVFRYGVNNLPFLCHRNGNLLHVIFIETKHGDIYDH